MSETEAQSEPSMEEILASIRRIITEDEIDDRTEADEDLEGADDEEPVELTRMVDEKGQVVDLDAKEKDEHVSDKTAAAEAEQSEEASSEAAVPAADPAESEETIELVEKTADSQGQAEQTPKDAAPDDDSLVSPHTKHAASASLAQVIHAVAVPEPDGAPASPQRSLEDVVRAALQPELRSWLDQNLAPLVERIVREEIKKMVRRVEDR